MLSSLILPSVVLYPCITVFAIACWYIGYSQGQSSIPIGFEVIELPAYMLSPEQLLAMAQAALSQYEAVMQASWDLKDQIENAATMEALPVIPASLMA